MNVIKEYNTAKKQKGNVAFGAAGGAKWNFRCSDKESGAWVKVMKVPGGKEVATKIADVISKSWLRTAGKKLDASARVDARARRQMDHLVGLRTVADWKGEPEWWHNDCSAEPSVGMIYVNRQPNGISAEDIAQDTALERATEPAIELAEAVTA